FYPAWSLVFRQPRADELLELSTQLRCSFDTGPQDHVRQRLDQPVVVLTPDHARFQNRGMLHEGILPPAGRNPNDAALEHRGATAGIPEEPIGVLVVLVARANPVALDGVLGLLVLVPIHGAGGIATYQQIADLARRHRLASLIENARLIASDQPARGPRPYGIRLVGDEDVHDLRRADAIQDGHAEAFSEPLEDGWWKRLAGRDTPAHRREIAPCLLRQQLSVIGRH